ncbi:type II/IV secretion system protein [Candidatus Dojkabacteria bacterium]|nr:type II/IV secretion system protein [Candidatus Dojkabacteria bacterium]
MDNNTAQSPGVSDTTQDGSKSPLLGSNFAATSPPLHDQPKITPSAPQVKSPLVDVLKNKDGEDAQVGSVPSTLPGEVQQAQVSQIDPVSSNQGTDATQDIALDESKQGPSFKGITVDDYKGKTIAEILREKGKLRPEQFEEVKFEIASRKGSEEEIIRRKGWLEEDEIVKAKAASYGVPYVDLKEVEIPREILTKLPYESARTHKAILFKDDPNIAHVGMEDPLDIQRVRFIESILGKSVKAYFANPGDIKDYLDTKYAGRIETEVTEAVEEVGEGVVKIEEGLRDIAEVEDTIATAPVARIVNMVLEYAVKFKASDVHIEPREKKLVVRFRINGVMMERLQLPPTLIASVVSRVKILSNLKIDEHRIPQDGRFQIKVGIKEVDLRVSIMPTVHGEKVVIRLLEKGGSVRRLEETGMRGSGFKVYREALEATQGILLVTGPTGSGKTQTLASSLLILNRPDVNIVTLEDPVEVKVDGVNQVQVNADVGLTFAKGLRSILRQDPDIIMVGEIRDQETAELAVQASLTGHLVLATLHTNSASGALPRLLDMKVEPYLLTSTVNIIVAQRLVRTICDKCKEAYKPSEEIVKTIHKVMVGLAGFDMYSFPKSTNPLSSPGQVNTQDPNQVPPRELEKQQEAKPAREVILYRGKGCSKCGDTGYSGRTGIFEVLRVSEKVAQLIMEHRSSGDIERQAKEEGMITMVQDGFLKALEGVTTIEEVLRVQKK